MQGRQQDDHVATSFATQLDARRVLPPGQRPADQWQIVHYGPVPRRKVHAGWDIMVFGATASGEQMVIDLAEVLRLPRLKVRADLHCVSGFSVMDLQWEGVAAQTLLAALESAVWLPSAGLILSGGDT